MNDAREALYGLDVIKQASNLIVPKSKAETSVLAEVQKVLGGAIGPEKVTRTYIACLSNKSDQLSQWRAYGRPRGFSIGFDKQQLQGMCAQDMEMGKPMYRNVIYDVDCQNNIVKEVFSNTTQGWVDFLARGQDVTSANSTAWVFLLEVLTKYAAAFKSPAFSEEQEVRLYMLHNVEEMVSEDIRFREGAMGLTPYAEVPLQDPEFNEISCINEIIVGPQSNQREAVRAVKQLLSHERIQNVDVKASEISLRP